MFCIYAASYAYHQPFSRKQQGFGRRSFLVGQASKVAAAVVVTTMIGPAASEAAEKLNAEEKKAIADAKKREAEQRRIAEETKKRLAVGRIGTI
jgi:IS5 family transposase